MKISVISIYNKVRLLLCYFVAIFRIEENAKLQLKVSKHKEGNFPQRNFTNKYSFLPWLRIHSLGRERKEEKHLATLGRRAALV
jgi:hypothetical protein